MKRFAVGYMNFFDNDLIVDVVEAVDWFEAIKKHRSLLQEANEWFSEIESLKLEDVKDKFFNNEELIDVKEII
jgi:hypothetical protein